MVSTLRVFHLQIAAGAHWGFLLGPGVGRSWRLRYVGVENQYVAWEAGRAPGVPGRDPDGGFANACAFLRARGPPARASAMDLVAAWLPGAPAHCLARRPQNRA